MAQLGKAIGDGHLYILAGQSQGTWQVSEAGEAWLRRNKYRIPEQGEKVSLDGGTYSWLRDKKYLYIKGIEYEKHQQDAQGYLQGESETIAEGLPLLLRMKEHTPAGWELALDLSALSDEAWKELQNHHVDRIIASGTSSPVLLKRLASLQSLLSVNPGIQSYSVYGTTGGYNRFTLRHVPETPGLNSTWQGNVFTERTQQPGTWRRRLSERTVSFSGAFLWLVKAEYDPEWVGKAERIGSIYADWQLWRLSMDEQAPASWEAIKNWFKYRSLYLVEQRQHLEIISPPTAITDDGHYIIQPEKQVLLACYPPSRFIEGLEKQISLTAELLDRPTSSPAAPSGDATSSFPANQVRYFRWSALYPGKYRIRIQGDASAEPLLIQAATPPPAQPLWLRGLTCTVISAQSQQTFQAFSDVPDGTSGKTVLQMEQFAPEALPTLTWRFEPEQLPIRLTWKASSSDGIHQPEMNSTIRSNEDLTQHWQQYIWPAIETSQQAKLTLDAGSFGRIELSIVMPRPPQIEQVWSLDERLATQFIWLSRFINAQRAQHVIPVPASTRNAVRHLSEQESIDSTLADALQRLSLAHTLPTWILFRLCTLLAEVEKQAENIASTR